MEGKLQLRIVTPTDLREESVSSVWLPGALVPMEIRPAHAPLTAALTAGEIRWRTGAGEERFAIRGGAVRVAQNVVTVCAEQA